jgi:hypothetical protein
VNDINIDATAPMIAVTATAPILWPPNGKLIPDAITGAMMDSLSGIDPATAAFHVVDKYGLLQPADRIVVAPDGNFRFPLMLDASRLGDDLAGRQYEIIVSAADKAGNRRAASTKVTVPHDLRR